jgi:cyclophilin family peptidyl-prolyl cis-trans isomerase
MINRILFVFIFALFINNANAKENTMILKLKNGDVVIELFDKIAPKHVERFKLLVKEKKYDGVVFHRVIEGFMAQTGDLEYGNSKSEKFDLSRAGTGGSKYPDLKAEFSSLPHEKGTLSR